MDSISEEDAARFWARVDTSGGPDACWEWLTNQRTETGERNAYGVSHWRMTLQPARWYSKFYINGKPYSAHRIAYILTYGSIPDGLLLRHRCSYEGCVNPSHLLPGTDEENSADRRVRRRRGILRRILFTYEDDQP